MACRDESRHVKSVAQEFTTALNEGLAAPLPGLSRHGCGARRTGCLPAVQCSNLWKFDQDGDGSDLADAGNGAENIMCARPFPTITQTRPEFIVKSRVSIAE